MSRLDTLLNHNIVYVLALVSTPVIYYQQQYIHSTNGSSTVYILKICTLSIGFYLTASLQAVQLIFYCVWKTPLICTCTDLGDINESWEGRQSLINKHIASNQLQIQSITVGEPQSDVDCCELHTNTTTNLTMIVTSTCIMFY